ncbi:MAG: Gfo/Idh/MocA family oxidoreductase [Proteobacteria bacterium]|nr:Gfo/Idh/MocA family oxidoreductase [Pseudomonadota bacterium]
MVHEIGIGLIGFGWMGQAHSRSYREIPKYFPDDEILPRLVGVADAVPERVGNAVRIFGYDFGTSDWRDLLARPDIDVIDVTAPTVLPREISAAAAAAGKHVFCEKPVGLSPSDTVAIERAASAAGIITGCGYNYRWAPMVQYTKHLIDEGRFGELTHYRGRFFSMYGRDRLGVLSWRFLRNEAGFGALTDIMSHAVDMALHLAGPIERQYDLAAVTQYAEGR